MHDIYRVYEGRRWRWVTQNGPQNFRPMTPVICVTHVTGEIKRPFIHRLFKVVELSKLIKTDAITIELIQILGQDHVRGSGTIDPPRPMWLTDPLRDSDEGNQRTMTQKCWCICRPQNSTGHVSIVSCGRYSPRQNQVFAINACVCQPDSFFNPGNIN